MKIEEELEMANSNKNGDELETANSDKSGDKSEIADSVQMFDSETLNQLKAKRKEAHHKKHQHRNRKGTEKGRTSRQADGKGRGARHQTGRGVRARREARRNQSVESGEREEPQAELEG